MAGSKVIVNQHLDRTITLTIGTRRVGHYTAEGKLLTPITKLQAETVEKTPLRLLTYETGHFTC